MSVPGTLEMGSWTPHTVTNLQTGVAETYYANPKTGNFVSEGGYNMLKQIESQYADSIREGSYNFETSSRTASLNETSSLLQRDPEMYSRLQQAIRQGVLFDANETPEFNQGLAQGGGAAAPAAGASSSIAESAGAIAGLIIGGAALSAEFEKREPDSSQPAVVPIQGQPKPSVPGGGLDPLPPVGEMHPVIVNGEVMPYRFGYLTRSGHKKKKHKKHKTHVVRPRGGSS